MANGKCLLCCSVVFILFLILSCDDSRRDRIETVFRTDPEIAEITPLNPVKIKLKRAARGEYSWDLSGDDVQKITEADTLLRAYISGSGKSAGSVREIPFNEKVPAAGH